MDNIYIEVVDKLIDHGARVDLQENVCFIMSLHTCTTSLIHSTDRMGGMR